jgi:hypothetical protein
MAKRLIYDYTSIGTYKTKEGIDTKIPFIKAMLWDSRPGKYDPQVVGKRERARRASRITPR